MKKIIPVLLVTLLIFVTVSCGNSKNNNQNEGRNDFAEACAQLDKSSMGATEYSETQIDEFEKRFTKMALEGGFTKVTHYRSTTDYAYVIEFENTSDAATFAERVASPKYNVKAYEKVVVYGESELIDSLK